MENLLNVAIVAAIVVGIMVGLSLAGVMMVMTYDIGATTLAKHYCPSPAR